MFKLIKVKDVTIEEIEAVHIISSKKEVRSLGLDQNYRCVFRNKKYPYYSGIYNIISFNRLLCPTTGCINCFYKIHNFLNVHKLIKKLKNEQANKLSKA